VRIERDRLRVYVLAIAAGLVAEIGLALAVDASGSLAIGLLFFVEPIVLGLVFGAGPGIAGAIVPWFVLYAAHVLTGGDQPVYIAFAVLFMMIVEAFLAGMAGAMKERYWTRSVPPPGA
jgi:hypothetical protein